MHVEVASSIEAFGRDEWNRLFPEELEDWSYYHAVERAGLPEFTWIYFGVRVESELRAVVPAFVTDYRLDTTLGGPLRFLTDAITRAFPRLLQQRMLCLGSPVGEICHLGFAPDTDAVAHHGMLGAIMDKVETYTKQHSIGMIAVKDASAVQDTLWKQSLGEHRLRRQPGLPTALLDLSFASVDDYLNSLSAATRKDMRRKLKAGAALRIEWQHDIQAIDDQIMRLYRSTMEKSELSFEELTPAYFNGVLSELGDRASCVTYWLGERLVAFNLVLHDGQRLLDKFLGMDYAMARDYNLYFYTWIENVRYCIAHSLPLYQSGQGLHREKLRLGSRLAPNWLWYRHRNRLLDFIFSGAERVFRLDRHDPELAALNPGTRMSSTSPRRSATTLAAWVALLSFETLCQISLKLAGRQTGPFDFSATAFRHGLATPWLWVAIGCYIGAFLAWMTILRKSTLSAAFTTSALVFVAVMLASWLVFGENIGWMQLLGAAIIVAGILMIGADANPDETPPPSTARQ